MGELQAYLILWPLVGLVTASVMKLTFDLIDALYP